MNLIEAFNLKEGDIVRSRYFTRKVSVVKKVSIINNIKVIELQHTLDNYCFYLKIEDFDGFDLLESFDVEELKPDLTLVREKNVFNPEKTSEYPVFDKIKSSLNILEGITKENLYLFLQQARKLNFAVDVIKNKKTIGQQIQPAA